MNVKDAVVIFNKITNLSTQDASRVLFTYLEGLEVISIKDLAQCIWSWQDCTGAIVEHAVKPMQ